MCLLCVVTPSISSTAGNVLAGKANMMTFTSVTSSHDRCLDYLLFHVTSCNASPSITAIVVVPLRWSRPQTGSVARKTVYHSYLRIPSSSVGRVTFSLSFGNALSQLSPPLRLFHMACGQSAVLVAYSCPISGSST